MRLYALAKAILRVLCTLRGVRVVGAENVPLDGGLIVACNHVSLLDPPILGTCCPRPIHYMAKRELFAIPVLGPTIRALGAYPVDREGTATGAIKRSLAVLRDGEAIGIFPEGGRNPRGEAQARAGVALLASLAGAPVLPAAIVGSNRALQFAAIRVAFGRPLRLDSGRKATREDLANFTATVMGEIRTLAGRVSDENACSA